MSKNKFYHVVTEKPMHLGQVIIFDNEHENAVARRINKVKRIREKVVNSIDDMDDIDKLIYEDFEKWSNIADREIALEKIRKEEFSDYPSRMACLYVSTSLEDAEKWADYFISVGRSTYQIVELENDGNQFTGDAHNCWYECPSEDESYIRARHYWNRKPNLKNEAPIYETIIAGRIKVIKIIKEFRI